MLLETNMLGTRTLRDRSTSRERDVKQEDRSKPKTKEKVNVKREMGEWVEPALAQKPSYRDHSGGSYYGVAEHMQPLGEAPNARVKARVKPDGARKSVLGRSGAALGLDAQETPEGTPAPPSTSQVQPEVSSPPRIVIKDEDDGEYAPVGNGKKKERTTRARVHRRQSATPAPANAERKKTAPSNIMYNGVEYDMKKIASVVEEAKIRAFEVGKPDLARAVNQIYLWSLDNHRIVELLQAILTHSATEDQTAEFHVWVKKAKTKLKEQKRAEIAKEAARNLPDNVNGSQSLPVRSPSKFTSASAENSAIPSTEPTDLSKPKISLKVKSPSNDSKRRRSGQSGTMSVSPSKDRSASPNSDSSLTDMTSNPDDDMDVDEPDGPEDNLPGSSRNGSVKAKDHAAERGSLAAPNRTLKRSSADAELEDEERERVLASKKQKLNETVTRDSQYGESNVRGLVNGTQSRLRSLRGKNQPLVLSALSVPTTGGRRTSARGSRAASSDPDSPLTEPASSSSRQSTPHVWKAPAKAFGKKAKTKQSYVHPNSFVHNS